MGPDLQTLVAAAAAAAHCGDEQRAKHADALRTLLPAFRAERFVASMPLKREPDREALVADLVLAGLER